MATLSETLTLAEFSARVTAGTLNIGQIYTITDKGWVLQAHTNTVAKPLHGALKLNNGDSLPDGIEPDEILLDSGIITDDIDNETALALVITKPAGYFPINCIIHCIENSGSGLENIFSSFFTPPTIKIVNGQKIAYPANVSEGLPINTTDDAISITGNGGGNTLRLIIEYRKSLL